MADSEAKKILGAVWASSADAERNDPKEFGLRREVGWPLAYEQIGGAEPEREVFNQKFREWDGAIAQTYVAGLPPWDASINYYFGADGAAFVLGSDAHIYVATRPSGPATGNPTDPTMRGQTAWRRY